MYRALSFPKSFPMRRVTPNKGGSMEITRRQRRIFHFFERVGYNSFASVQRDAQKAFPSQPTDIALEAFYKRELEKSKSRVAQQTDTFYRQNEQEMDSILAGQVIHP